LKDVYEILSPPEMAWAALAKKAGYKPKPKPVEKNKPLSPLRPVDVSSSGDEEGSGDGNQTCEGDDEVDEDGTPWTERGVPRCLGCR